MGNVVRHGRKGTTVKLELDDGHTIVRRKGKIRNEYELDGRKFKSFGAQVPAPVADFLKVSTINFQKQIDPYFWFSNTPGQVSKELNRIVNLEVIDSTLSNISSRLRKAKTTVEVSRSRLKEAKAQRRKLRLVPELANYLGKLEAKLTTIVEERARIDEAAILVNKVQSLKEARDRAAQAILDGQETLIQGKKLGEARERLRNLSQAVKQARDLEKTLCQLKDEVGTKLAAMEKLIGLGCPICMRPMPKTPS